MWSRSIARGGGACTRRGDAPVNRVVSVCAAVVTALAAAPPSWAQTTPGPSVLVFSGRAQRVLALHYQPHPTELMGCLLGTLRGGDTVRVERIAPADVDPVHSTPTHVLPKQTCEEAGWAPTVGTIHSHPAGERCWYFFPGTRVPSSDGQSFLRSPYPVDAILCGDRVVWIGRDTVEKYVALEASP